MSALRDPQPIAHLLYQLRSLEYNLDTTHDSMLDLPPTNRSPTLPSIQHRKWCSVNTIMITIVVGELNQWKVSIPTPSKIQHTSSEHIFKRLNRPLDLAIVLRVVCYTKVQLSTQLLKELLPK